jgi:hypothetical protein
MAAIAWEMAQLPSDEASSRSNGTGETAWITSATLVTFVRAGRETPATSGCVSSVHRGRELPPPGRTQAATAARRLLLTHPSLENPLPRSRFPPTSSLYFSTAPRCTFQLAFALYVPITCRKRNPAFLSGVL